MIYQKTNDSDGRDQSAVASHDIVFLGNVHPKDGGPTNRWYVTNLDVPYEVEVRYKSTSPLKELVSKTVCAAGTTTYERKSKKIWLAWRIQRGGTDVKNTRPSMQGYQRSSDDETRSDVIQCQNALPVFSGALLLQGPHAPWEQCASDLQKRSR